MADCFPFQFLHLLRANFYSNCLFFLQNGSRLWHNRLGHPNASTMSTLFKSGLLNKPFHSASFECDACKLGKSKTLPFPHSTTRSTECFDLIHSDVQGIAPHLSYGHFKYFVTFIDDFSRFTWVYLLHSKSDVLNAFQFFLSYVEIQFSKCIKTLYSNSGGEYVSNNFQPFLKTKGIISQRTCPNTS